MRTGGFRRATPKCIRNSKADYLVGRIWGYTGTSSQAMWQIITCKDGFLLAVLFALCSSLFIHPSAIMRVGVPSVWALGTEERRSHEQSDMRALQLCPCINGFLGLPLQMDREWELKVVLYSGIESTSPIVIPEPPWSLRDLEVTPDVVPLEMCPCVIGMGRDSLTSRWRPVCGVVCFLSRATPRTRTAAQRASIRANLAMNGRSAASSDLAFILNFGNFPIDEQIPESHFQYPICDVQDQHNVRCGGRREGNLLPSHGQSVLGELLDVFSKWEPRGGPNSENPASVTGVGIFTSTAKRGNGGTAE
ncbi:hypothetical protein SODALDRAFT_360639 [Sodiomyces alkalinus F11]|uniref:Uncharacterized protein n=1 Tax=Sodiomyces alkalinus (strain CBS 110278 / VKM F-3762 / F11) TaxID=1314773 RepID=A0A3N2PUV0_SODAK|nr:hypothetical protein SODALDRAFT_360639 [Sodiomyces alkalinus F11]ROT38283.1 hypothetical protein SODALDRAFT_360639 [Sodiomyces alkalinus F11]